MWNSYPSIQVIHSSMRIYLFPFIVCCWYMEANVYRCFAHLYHLYSTCLLAVYSWWAELAGYVGLKIVAHSAESKCMVYSQITCTRGSIYLIPLAISSSTLWFTKWVTTIHLYWNENKNVKTTPKNTLTLLRKLIISLCLSLYPALKHVYLLPTRVS